MNRQQRLCKNVDIIARKRRRDLDIQDAAYTTVPYAYSTIVMALKEYTDMSDEDIIYIIQRSYQIWNDWPYDVDVDPLEICRQVTGISLEGYNKNANT